MGRKKRVNQVELATRDIVGSKMSETFKDPYKFTVRAYRQEGELKILQNKRNFLPREGLKKAEKTFKQWCDETYKNFTVELIEVVPNKVIKSNGVI